jgi:hypothetical protein
MKNKKIVTFVHTEYHLMLFVNRLLSEKEVEIKNNHQLFIRSKNTSRISENLDLSSLPVKIQYIKAEFKNTKPMSHASKLILEELSKLQPDEFVFYQEMDLLMLILANQLKKLNNTKIVLFQDGSKPYHILKFNSFGLIKHHHKTNVWMKKNGFSIDSWLSPFWSHRYAFTRAIDEIRLTFPESYINWNKKKIRKIEFSNPEELKLQLNEIFRWNDNILPHKEGVILYLSQPLNDDGIVESEFIRKLIKKFPSKQVYIKTHPLTPKSKIDEYKKCSNSKVIQAKIPAELFIMQLKKSIILSVDSTAMYLDNPNCKFYFLRNIFKKDIKRIRRYNVKIAPASHIKLANSIQDISFQ